jgi:hypothetical protein
MHEGSLMETKKRAMLTTKTEKAQELLQIWT